MRAILHFIIRQHNFLLFLLIEIICLTLTIKNNEYQQNVSYAILKELSGTFHNVYYSFKQYISAVEENKKLAEENAKLRTILYNIKTKDSVLILNNFINYDFIPANIVYATIYTSNNYIIIDKGLKDSIMPDMGVISPTGVVGIIKDVSDNFSTVLPIINVNAHISARVKTNSYFGTTSWDGKNSRYINLSEIPYHVKLKIGDTVITSGFSTIFPEGIEIGTISYFDYNEGNDFYNISVKLNTDFSCLKKVYIVKNKLLNEYKKIEQTIKSE